MGLKIAAWILFISIVLGGTLWGCEFPPLVHAIPSAALRSFVVALCSALVAFLVMAGLMVLLDLAQDMRLLRIKMTEQDEKPSF